MRGEASKKMLEVHITQIALSILTSYSGYHWDMVQEMISTFGVAGGHNICMGFIESAMTEAIEGFMLEAQIEGHEGAAVAIDVEEVGKDKNNALTDALKHAVATAKKSLN